MKRNLIFIFMLLFSVAAMAQSQSLGVQVAFNEPILRQNTLLAPKKLNQPTTLNGFKVGVLYDATLIKGFGFTLGINYAFGARNTSWPSNIVNGSKREQQLMHTFELPIDWQYKFEIAKQTWLIVYTGPTIQYNFSFKEKTYTKLWSDVAHDFVVSSASKSHYDIDIDKDGIADYSPLNITWGLGAGFQYKNYYLRGGYDFGIYSHFKDAQNDVLNYRNRARLDQWNIRLGIYFLNF